MNRIEIGHPALPGQAGEGAVSRVILAGGGHAHLAVLADWARHEFPNTQRVLVTASRFTAYSGLLPAWMAGICRRQDLMIDLEPLARKAGTTLIIDRVCGLDADKRTLLLAGGLALEFDLLSLATGGEADLSALASLGPRVLAVKPVDDFMQGWAVLVAKVRAGACIRLAVVGGGAAGVEMALAAEVALRGIGSPVALIVPQGEFLKGHADGVRRRVLAEFARRGIALHHGHAVGAQDGLLLSDGTSLPASHVIAATGSRAPSWLARSGLRTTDAGFVAVGADLRSVSHPNILAAGDIVERIDRLLPRSGVHAVKSGPVLAANLRAALADRPMRTYRPRERTLYLMATGERRAIGSWGKLAFGGRLAWWLKNWIDRRFIARQRPGGPPDALQ